MNILTDLELVLAPDRNKDLPNLDPGSCAMSFTESSSHPCLKPISSSARQHLIDPENHERVDADPDVELVLAAVLDEVLVAADTGCLQGLAGQLLQLIGHLHQQDGYEDDLQMLKLTMCTDRGNSSTPALFLPRSKILIFGSGTPRLNLLLGYGLFLQ